MQSVKLILQHIITISAYLKQHGVIRFTPPICTEIGCNREMSWIRDRGSSDGWMWRSPCHRRKRACRTGSQFAESHLPLRKLVQLLYCWCHRMPNYAAGNFNSRYPKFQFQLFYFYLTKDLHTCENKHFLLNKR